MEQEYEEGTTKFLSIALVESTSALVVARVAHCRKMSSFSLEGVSGANAVGNPFAGRILPDSQANDTTVSVPLVLPKVTSNTPSFVAQKSSAHHPIAQSTSIPTRNPFAGLSTPTPT